jgi:hypothetical protein
MKRVVSFMLTILCLACEDRGVPPEPYQPSIQLSALDASCTEAWLKVTLSPTSSGQSDSVILKRNGQTLLTLGLPTLDSVLIDEGLLPNHTYTYKAYRLSAGAIAKAELTDSRLSDSSSQVTLTTLDTTSHDFILQIDTLGDGGGSVLYDVAIINDTLAYAVGAIYLRDSLGNWDPHAYNMARWDGTSWELMRTQFYTICGQSSRTPYPAKAIFAFSATDIWIAMDGDQVARWNGSTQTATTCLPVSFSINKLWGENSNSVYAVGSGGNIMLYSNGTWQRLESGTGQYLQDVWGIFNQQTGERIVLCAASHPLGYGEKKILSINQSNTVDTLPWPSQRVVMSVWISKPSTFYTCGGGVFRRGIEQQWKEIAGANVISTLTEKVRGRADNDIFVVGDFGVVAHFNGVSFRLYPEAAAALVYTSLDYKGNQMVAIGYTSSRGIVVRGVRN